MRQTLPGVIFVVGPTSSGKTVLGIALAKKFNGEIINADARQAYREANIGTGKPPGKKERWYGHRVYIVQDVPHYLMDDVPPNKSVTVVEWRKKALKTIREIYARDHLPIVVGGTGLYIQTLVDNYKIPPIPPQLSFREAMGAKSLSELVEMLARLDPEATKTVDLKNPRRVLRALEVVTFSGKPFSQLQVRATPVVDPLLIGIARTRTELDARIDAAIGVMIKDGWEDEVRRLLDQGVSIEAPVMTSIGYRDIASFVRGECSWEEAVKRAKHATHQYAKRQMTWFKRDPRIHWVKDESMAEQIVREWQKDRKEARHEACSTL